MYPHLPDREYCSGKPHKKRLYGEEEGPETRIEEQDELFKATRHGEAKWRTNPREEQREEEEADVQGGGYSFTERALHTHRGELELAKLCKISMFVFSFANHFLLPTFIPE